MLADLGADVIKVEPPGGSATRGVGPFVDGEKGPERSLFWASYCANKRGVTLDLESEAGAARLRSLAATADIILESFRPGYMAKLGLGYDDLSADNPALVYTSITPFGQSGPYSQYLATGPGGLVYGRDAVLGRRRGQAARPRERAAGGTARRSAGRRRNYGRPLARREYRTRPAR